MSSMNLIGIDFGSHTASVAVWHEDKALLEVLADDLGFRSIPSFVAFRGDETIVGQSAMGQQHKNTANTFEDVRSLLLSDDRTVVNVPHLEKEVSVEEINSIFFRNIHNQVKQQAGKVIREAVVSVPYELSEATKQKFITAAQNGGIRIKSFILDTSAALLAYGLDDPSLPASRTLVVDLGWSRCTMSLFSISGGKFVHLATETTTEASGAIFVKALAEFCAKDFTRKTKIPCQENARSMLRLKRECENAMKAMSTGQEATIDLDSLCEGMDYSNKISRARFEDLLAIPLIHFKNLLTATLAKGGVDPSSVTQICLSGGPSSLPRFVMTLRTMLPSAHLPKVRFETSEAVCIGAAVHGRELYQLGLLDNAPTASPTIQGLAQAIVISSHADAHHPSASKVTLLPRGTPLTAVGELPLSFPADITEGTLHIFAEDSTTAMTHLGGLSFIKDISSEEGYVLTVHVNAENGLSAQIIATTSKTVLQSLTIALV